MKAARNNKHIFNLEYIELCKEKKIEPPKHKGVLFNVQIVKDMGTPTIIAISNCDASNAQEIN
jgi:hypothetical protein